MQKEKNDPRTSCLAPVIPDLQRTMTDEKQHLIVIPIEGRPYRAVSFDDGMYMKHVRKISPEFQRIQCVDPHDLEICSLFTGCDPEWKRAAELLRKDGIQVRVDEEGALHSCVNPAVINRTYARYGWPPQVFSNVFVICPDEDYAWQFQSAPS